MDFGEALKSLKNGKRVARAGWNGKGMWLGLVSGDDWQLTITFDRKPAFMESSTDLGHFILPWIGMRTVDNGFVPWLASQTDLLAEDWVLVV